MLVHENTTTLRKATEHQKVMMARKHYEILKDFEGLGLDTKMPHETLIFNDEDGIIIKTVWSGPAWQADAFTEQINKLIEEFGLGKE